MPPHFPSKRQKYPGLPLIVHVPHNVISPNVENIWIEFFYACSSHHFDIDALFIWYFIDLIFKFHAIIEEIFIEYTTVVVYIRAAMHYQPHITSLFHISILIYWSYFTITKYHA